MLSGLSLPGLFSLLASAFALMASPGPATLSVAAMAAAYGIRPSLAYFIGVNLGTIVVLLAIALGASTLLFTLPALALPVSIAASIYILYLAFRIATAPPLAHRTAEMSPGLLPGLLLAIANPKAYIAIAAVYSKAMLTPASALADAILKCLILSGVIFLIHLLWAFAGAALTTTLRQPRSSRVVNLMLGAVLVLLVLIDAWAALRPM